MTLLVSQPVPDFTAAAVLADGKIVDNFNLYAEIHGHYGIIFFYPLNFTFVCPSELIALNNRIAEFDKLNAKVIAISIDSQFTHQAWRNKPVAEGGIGTLAYPLVSDLAHRICRAYGVEHPTAYVALRSAILVDKKGIVRGQITYDLPLGRNIDELIRTIQALEFHEQHGEVCPAGWTAGKTGIKPTSEGIAEYLAESAAGL